jgi:hypothetical protein
VLKATDVLLQDVRRDRSQQQAGADDEDQQVVEVAEDRDESGTMSIGIARYRIKATAISPAEAPPPVPEERGRESELVAEPQLRNALRQPLLVRVWSPTRRRRR